MLYNSSNERGQRESDNTHIYTSNITRIIKQRETEEEKWTKNINVYKRQILYIKERDRWEIEMQRQEQRRFKKEKKKIILRFMEICTTIGQEEPRRLNYPQALRQ